MNEVKLLEKLGACNDAVSFVRDECGGDLSVAWGRCSRPDWMLWLLRESRFEDKKTIVIFAYWCAMETPVGDDKKTRDLLKKESLDALDVVLRYANGMASETELDAARYAAWAAQSEQLRKMVPFKVVNELIVKNEVKNG